VQQRVGTATMAPDDVQVMDALNASLGIDPDSDIDLRLVVPNSATSGPCGPDTQPPIGPVVGPATASTATSTGNDDVWENEPVEAREERLWSAAGYDGDLEAALAESMKIASLDALD
jgi:hypothetical protein